MSMHALHGPAHAAHRPLASRRARARRARHDTCSRGRMHDVLLPLPPLLLLKIAVAAVWLYEGLWCKVLGREPHQVQVVQAVPKLGPLVGRQVLFALGLAETALGFWVLSGVDPGLCAIVQTVLLVTLNANGLLWARHVIHDPSGMVVKNVAFLLLAWVGAALSGAAT